MSSPYTASSTIIQGLENSRPGIQVKFSNKITRTNHELIIMYCTDYKLYCFRPRGGDKIKEIRAEELRKIVEERVKLARSAAPQGSSDLLVRQPQVVTWGSKLAFNKESLVTPFVGYKPVMGRKNDESCMVKYLKKIMVNGLQDPQVGPRSAFLPEGAPLLEYLAVYQERMDAWKYPTREEVNLFERARGLSMKMLDEVEVRVIVVEKTSPERIKETIEWFWERWLDSQEKCPTQVVSLDNEQVSLTLYDMYRMAGKLKTSGKQRRSKDKEPRGSQDVIEDDRFIPLPAKIMLGDGFRFCLIISINLDTDQDGEYLIKRMEVQDQLLDFLEEIPVAVGVGVSRDVVDIEFFFSLISGRNIEMKGSVELGSLAVLAGYEFQATNMTALGVQVCGTILNKTCSTGDDKWGWSWREIPEALQVYGLGDIRFGYMCYSILAGILLADTFPDPDICCRYLNSGQLKFTSFFMDWLRSSLEGIDVCSEKMREAESRKDLINSLRFRMVDGSILSDHPPNRIRIWSRLVGNWPTITSGGCRFMLQARIKFIKQMEMLRRINFVWRFNLILPEISQEFREYARFGISRALIKRVIWSEEVPETQGFELSRPESLDAPMIEIIPETEKCSQIMKFCIQNGRMQKYVLWEWCRMNPNKIVNFLQRMAKDKDYQTYYRPLYDGIRLIFWRVVNQETIKIQFIEEDQDGIIKRQRLRAEAMMEKSRAELEAYTKRAEYLRKVEKSGDKVERSRWREKLPQLPEWKLRRKRKRELRRLSEIEEESSAKRRKLGSVKSRLGSCKPSQHRESSESERSELNTDLENAFDGADESAPKCKRILTMSARKKKGKKKKFSGGLSEDLLRNLVTLENYEYEGKKRTESDEEFEATMRGNNQDPDVVLETQFNEELE